MEGRWTIWHTEGTERRCVSQVMAAVSGPAVLAGAPVYVVPCDDAAIDRAAVSIDAEVKRRAQYYGLDNWEPREVAEWILRAAGEAP